jgi:hypothetical protein
LTHFLQSVRIRLRLSGQFLVGGRQLSDCCDQGALFVSFREKYRHLVFSNADGASDEVYMVKALLTGQKGVLSDAAREYGLQGLRAKLDELVAWAEEEERLYPSNELKGKPCVPIQTDSSQSILRRAPLIESMLDQI